MLGSPQDFLMIKKAHTIDHIHPIIQNAVINCKTPTMACVFEQGSAHMLDMSVPNPGTMQLTTVQNMLRFCVKK